MLSAWSPSALLRLAATGAEVFALAGTTFGETSANAASDGSGCAVSVVVGVAVGGVERESGAIHFFPIAGAVPLIVLVMDVPSTRWVVVPGADPGGLAPAGAPGTTTPACGVGPESIWAAEPGVDEPVVGWPVVAEVVGGPVAVTGGLVVGDVAGCGAAVVGVGATVVGVGAAVVGVGATVVAVGATVVAVAVGVLVVVSDGLVSDGLGFFLT